jgi:tRNA pseudouridine38-40 synthase
MRKIKLIIAYDGTDFHGWQIQPEVRTVSGEIKSALEKILRHEISLTAASRTDAGVHALGQTADFHTDNSIETGKLLLALNGVLPDDVAVKSVEEVSEDFHSTHKAKGKHYRYFIRLSGIDDPLSRKYHWWYHHKLDVDKIIDATKFLTGTVDFKGLEINSGKPDVETIREISEIKIVRDGDDLIIDIFGKSFMYKLVRSMVGLLVAAGNGKIQLEEIPEILSGKNAHRKTDVAPPHGLTLVEVYY